MENIIASIARVYCTSHPLQVGDIVFVVMDNGYFNGQVAGFSQQLILIELDNNLNILHSINDLLFLTN